MRIRPSRRSHRLVVRGGKAVVALLALGAAVVLSARPALASGSLGTSHHWYAGASQWFTGVGVSAKLSQPSPVTSNWETSQARISALDSTGQHGIEVGWWKNPTAYGDSKLHLMVVKINLGDPNEPYCWADWPNFNNDYCDWVQISTTRYPGKALSITSVPQAFEIYYSGGNWWVGYQGEWIGYIPASSFTGAFTQMSVATWYGVVGANDTSPCSEMGNGHYGTQTGAATIASMAVRDLAGSHVAAAITFATSPTRYSVGAFTGSSLAYGGPHC